MGISWCATLRSRQIFGQTLQKHGTEQAPVKPAKKASTVPVEQAAAAPAEQVAKVEDAQDATSTKSTDAPEATSKPDNKAANTQTDDDTA